MDKVGLLKGILEQNPGDTFARYGLAMEYVAQKRVAEGLAEFNRIIADNPDYVPAYQMSAQTLAANGETERAVARLQRRNRVGEPDREPACAGGDGRR